MPIRLDESKALPVMATSVTEPDVRTPLNSLRGTPAKARIAANPAGEADLLDLIAQALRATNTSQKAFAIAAEQSPSVISEALCGRRHFAIEWVWAQDDRFLATFFELAQAARRLTPESRSAINRKRIVELLDLLLQETA
jgi:hypothetical protein